MKLSRFVARPALFAALIASSVAIAGGQQAPPMPTPGPEHQHLKMDAGTWDATVEITPGPGMPPLTSKGVEVNTIGCGGLCLITDFKGEMMPGVQFQGHGVMTWDPARKKLRRKLDRLVFAGACPHRSHVGSGQEAGGGLDGGPRHDGPRRQVAIRRAVRRRRHTRDDCLRTRTGRQGNAGDAHHLHAPEVARADRSRH